MGFSFKNNLTGLALYVARAKGVVGGYFGF
jgi:hypothetical protein